MDILAQLQMLLAMPGIAESLEPIAKALLGKPGFGLSWLGLDASRSLQYNIENARRRAQLHSAEFYGQLQAAQNTVTTNLMTSWYTAMGYDPDQARVAAQQGSGGILHTLGETFLVRPQIDAAYYNIGNALYSRGPAWDRNAPYSNAGQAGAYWRAGGNLLNEVIVEAANKGYAGLSVKDASAIAGAMIRSGAFEEEGPFGAQESQPGRTSARIKKFSQELRSYAASIGTLQDVIQGPVEDIMQAFEKLTGNRLVSMSTGRVAALSNAMRNVLSAGNIDQMGLRNLTAQQYGLIAPFGGTMAQAAAMALGTAGAVNAAPRIEGLSDLQLGVGIAQDNAKMLLSGITRQYAAAQVYWRRANNMEDTPENREQFYRMLRTRYSGMSRTEAIQQYLKDNNVNSAMMTSVSVTNAMADPTIMTEARMDMVDNYRQAVGKYVDNLSLDPEVKNQLKAKLGTTYDLGRIGDFLSKAGVKDQNLIGQIEKNLGLIARSITDMGDTAVAMGTIGSNAAAANATRMTLAGNRYAKYQGVRLGQGGLEGLVSSMMADPEANGWTIGQMLASFMGLDYEAAAQRAEAFGKAWDAVKGDEETQKRERMKLLIDAGLDDDMVKNIAALGANGMKILTAKVLKVWAIKP